MGDLYPVSLVMWFKQPILTFAHAEDCFITSKHPMDLLRRSTPMEVPDRRSSMRLRRSLGWRQRKARKSREL